MVGPPVGEQERVSWVTVAAVIVKPTAFDEPPLVTTEMLNVPSEAFAGIVKVVVI
jgi:hypothetical protein